jgi:tetratricopeptide (TPR) repeat protein
MSPPPAPRRSAVEPFCRAVVLMLAVAGRIDAASLQVAGSAAPPQAAFDVDLTLPKTAVLTVPSGTSLDIRLRNAVPSALYRISIGTRGLPAHRFDLPKPFSTVASYAARAGCGDLTREALAFLSLAEESEIAARIPALEQSAARSDCGAAAVLLQETVKQTRPSLRVTYQLKPDEELVVTVERVSRESNQTLKSWAAAFRAGAPDVGWRFPTEQVWVVHEIAEAIADMAFFAGHRGAPAPADVDVAVEVAPQPGVAAPRFQLRVRAGATAQIVTAQPHVWAPASYDVLARFLLSSLKPSPAPAAPPVLEALTDLRGVVIEAERRRVADRVTAYPLDAAAHEQAALVAGALGLREAAGIYADPRSTLNRMAAHLAFARALRGPAPSGPDGRLAEIVLNTLVGRQREGLAALESLKAGRPSKGESAWIDALMTRNDGDWRRIKSPASSTLLERIEYFRAAGRGAGVAQALIALGPRLEPVADWSREVLQRPFSVGEGQQFVPPSIPLELAEMRAVWLVAHPGATPPERPSALLDASPGRAVATRDGRTRIQVLDRGDWSAFFRRHVFQDVDRGEWFFNRMLRIKEEEAQKWVATADEAFGALPGYALVSLRPAIPALDADGPFAALCARIKALALESPERITPTSWSMAARKCGSSMPPPTGWLSPLIPAETALDTQRFMLPEFLGVPAAQLDRLRWIAPFEPLLRRPALAGASADQPATKTVPHPESAGPGHEMATLTQELAVQQDPAERRKIAQRMCDLSDDRCLVLGWVLVQQGREADAAGAYERAVARAEDRIAVSNQVGWLVNYYFRRGDKVKAERVARMAAEVYSEQGLLTMAELMERMGRYPEAEDHYRKVKKRYEQDTSLKRFYIRYRHDVAGPLFAAESESAMKELFPAGLQRAKLADFTLAPSAGVSVVTSPDVQKLTGLNQDDVIVAINGYRVKTYEQYDVIRGFRAAGKKPLLVWHQGAYVEMPDAPLPQRGLLFMTLGARTGIGPKPAGLEGKSPDYWIKAIRDASPVDRPLIPAAIATMGEALVPGLLGLLKDPDGMVQMRGIDAFRFMLPPPASAAPGLVEALKTVSPMVKGPILSTLGKMGPVHEAVIPAVVAHLDDPALATWAAAALGEMGPAARSAIPALEKARDRAAAASRQYYENALQRIRPK